MLRDQCKSHMLALSTPLDVFLLGFHASQLSYAAKQKLPCSCLLVDVIYSVWHWIICLLLWFRHCEPALYVSRPLVTPY